MPMRDYFPLDKIEIPEAQEKIMDIMCEAWEECRESECKGCADRKNGFMSVRECLSLKESRKLVEAGYVKVVRCKDCKHYYHYGKTSLLIDGKNVKAGWCQRRTRFDEEYRMTPDDFCSYGEMKGE